MTNNLTESNATQLRKALRGHDLEAMITLALVTGMRRDELLHLQWQDIDLDKRELRVQNIKTARHCRIIRYSDDVIEVLKQHRLRQTATLLQASPHADLVFPDPAGAVKRPHQLLKAFYEVLEQAELPYVRFHDLRVTLWRGLGQ